MPFYEYVCDDCGTKFDKFVRSMSAQFEVECPECHGKHCKKQFSTFGSSSSGASSSSFSGAANCAPSG